MASYADASSIPSTNAAGTTQEDGVCNSYESEMGERAVDELQRVRLAHEGMRLLLNSEVTQAQDLFRAARYLGPELNAGYSFVQFVRSLMTFEEDALDQAYRNLEATEKFCETGKKLSSLFTGQGTQDKLSPHMRLFRKSIVADCLLFESILVFLKQSMTSYVKGGYILRKAWKMYEKIFQETEELCSLPSPIARAGQSSPTDRHVGRSVYDDGEGQDNDVIPEEGEEALESTEDFKSSMVALGDSLANMHLAFGIVEGEGDAPNMLLEPAIPRSDSPSSSESAPNRTNMQLHVTPSESDFSSCSGEQTTSDSNARVNGSSSQEEEDASVNPAIVVRSSFAAVAPGTGITRTSGSRTGSEEDLLRASNSLAMDGGGVDQPDLGVKKRKKRPKSGYFLSEVPSSSVLDLEHEDSRLRGAVYFGYGLMNVIMSLIPPKLMKLANLFGFHGCRRVGLQALEFACNSQDMKAPLARIGLLWYHTIVRPFFALDGEDEAAGVEEAERLLVQSQEQYPNSALFLYFKGKVLYLRCQLQDALQVYSAAAELSGGQREIEHIALYEKGWIHFLQLNYAHALPCYIRLKNETRWSACYYAYLAAVMTGAQGDLKQSRELFLQSSKLVKRKNNNLEKFCARRSYHYKKEVTLLMPLETRLMAVEVIYLWRALPFCSRATKEELVQVLGMALPPTAGPYHQALRAWLLGGVLSSLKRTAEAERRLREAMQYEAQVKHDKHIFSFALYELAMIHISRAEYVRARAMLDLAREQFSGYEFEARLHFKVHSALNLLK